MFHCISERGLHIFYCILKLERASHLGSQRASHLGGAREPYWVKTSRSSPLKTSNFTSGRSCTCEEGFISGTPSSHLYRCEEGIPDVKPYLASHL